MELTDQEMLTALHLRDNGGLSSQKIADALGVSRGTVIGALQRIDQTQEPCRCVKPENRDGAMPPLWWVRNEALDRRSFLSGATVWRPKMRKTRKVVLGRLTHG